MLRLCSFLGFCSLPLLFAHQRISEQGLCIFESPLVLAADAWRLVQRVSWRETGGVQPQWTVLDPGLFVEFSADAPRLAQDAFHVPLLGLGCTAHAELFQRFQLGLLLFCCALCGRLDTPGEIGMPDAQAVRIGWGLW